MTAGTLGFHLRIWNLGKQLGLQFSEPDSPTPEISGKEYISNYITTGEAENLRKRIDKETWLDDLKRRVQHYGYKYDYKARRIDETMLIGELPDWGSELAKRFCAEGKFSREPNQLIVNEYKSGQGISRHIDCEPCFDETIISLSLGSPVIMNFINSADKDDKREQPLEARGLLILTHEARYKWLHEIPARKNHIIDGFKRPLEHTISLTFRCVKS